MYEFEFVAHLIFHNTVKTARDEHHERQNPAYLDRLTKSQIIPSLRLVKKLTLKHTEMKNLSKYYLSRTRTLAPSILFLL